MYDRHRERMVKECVIDRGITDQRLIAAMGKVPRHQFVETAMSHQAYADKSLPIGHSQTISRPTTVADMTRALQISGQERVLEIGTGSGYQTAILAEMGAKVYSIERIPELARRAQRLFEELNYFTVAVRIGDGSVGWSAHAPYDRIIVTAASPEIPRGLLKQLKNSGRMVAPVGNESQQKLIIITRENDKYSILEGNSRRFVPLIGKEGWTL